MSRQYKTRLVITGDASGGIRAIKATEDELGKLNEGFARGSRDSRRFGSDAERAGQQVREIGHGSTEASKGLTLVRQAATLAAAAFSIRQLGVYADGWSEINSRVLNATKDIDVSEQTMVRLAETARRTYSDLNQTAEAFLNNSTTLTEMGYSTERQLDLSEALNNALVISATKGQQADSVLQSLTKAFAAGELRGDNFNTVIQSGGRIAEALAAGLGVTTIELRKMAAEGEITASRLFESLTSQMEVLRKEAEEMPATIADGWTQIGNSAMELVGRLDKAAGASEGIAGVMINAADAMSAAIDPLVDHIGKIQVAASLTAAVITGRYAAAFAVAVQSKAADVTASMAQVRANVAATTAARAKAAETLRVAVADQEAARRALANGHAIATATGNTTLRTKAITQMAAANQRAIAAEAAHTSAVNANAAAIGRSTVAARTGAGALALMGGPMGAAVVAGLGLYYFRDQLGLTDDKMQGTIGNIESLGSSFIEEIGGLGAEISGAFGGMRAEMMDIDAGFIDMKASAVESFAGIVDSSASVVNMGLIPIQNAINALDTTFAGLINRTANALESAGAMPFGMANVFGEQITRLRAMSDGLLDGLIEPIGISTDALEDNSQALRNQANALRASADEIRGSIMPANADLIVTFQTLDQWLDEIERGAGRAGNSLRDNAPDAQTLEAWEKYNDKLRDSLAAARDPSAVGAANRELDTMGVTDPIRRAITVGLALQEDATKRQKELHREAASAAQQAARTQAQAAQQAARAAEQSSKKQADALLGIQHEMTPLLADHATYIERLGVLDKALAEGTISEEAYGDAIRWAADQYTRAATGADDYEKQTASLISTYDSHNQKAQQLRAELEQINQRWRDDPDNAAQYARMIAGVRDEMQQLALDADPAAQEMARAWEEASNRIDETFADAFAGAFESFDDFGDQLLDGFKRLLAELAYQATLKPIVVAFTGDMQSMMGIGGAAGGGGLANTFGAARGLLNGSSLLGGGAAAGGAALSGGFMSAAATQSASSLYGMAATGGVASTAASAGIMSSISSGVSAAMPWIGGALLADNVLGLGITSGITKAFGSLFGGGKTPFYGALGTSGDGAGIKQYRTETALGTTGFTRTQRLEKATSEGTQEWAASLMDASVALDSVIAGLARNEGELTAMKSAVAGFGVASGNVNDLIKGQLIDRTFAALEAAGHSVESAWRHLETGEFAQRIEQAGAALAVMMGVSDQLGLSFDTSASTALMASNNIAELTGGLDQLASLQSSYYQAYYSEAERAASLQDDLTQSLAAMGLQLPQSRDGYRRLVEAQNLNTEAGQRAYATLLRLAPAFADLVQDMGDLGATTRDFAAELSAARDVVATAEGDVRSAYQAFESQSFSQQIALLELMGDSQAALALQRERELEGIDPLLHESQRRYWALEDEAAAQQKATQAAQSYVSELTRVRDELSNSLGSINSWMDQQNATGGTPGMNLAETRDQLARQLVLAESGDRSALQSITQYADRVLAANDEYNASGPAGQAIRDEVLAALEALPGQISAEEYLAQEFRDALQKAVDELPGGIAGSLHPLFDSIDLDASGLIDWQEFYSVFQGMASDDELRRIFNKLDADGSGTISRLESLNRSNEGTEDNTSTLEDRARDQLKELNGLVSEMTRTTDQFVGLNSGINSLSDSINALGVAQAQAAQIEKDRVAAEKAERDRIAREREQAARAALINSNIEGFVSAANVAENRAETLSGRLDPRDAGNISRLIDNRMNDGQFTNSEWEQMLAHLASTFGRDSLEYLFGREYSAMYRNQTRANEERAKLDGSHADGNWNVAFDGYIAELHKDEMVVPARTANMLRDLPSRGLPMPDIPMPQFPQLGNADVVQVLKDLRNENKQLRSDINRLLGDVKTNTGNTANAVSSSASRAERQRSDQLEEQRAATRAARLKGRTS